MNLSFLFPFVLLAASTFVQQPSPFMWYPTIIVKAQQDTLYWREGVSLTWDDFKSKAPKQTGFAAYTYTIITMGYELKTSGETYKPKFTVNSAFQRSKSWVDRKDPKAQTPEILAHEQLHFTIAEITARKLRRNLKSATYTKNYRNEIKEIYEQTLAQGEKMQQRYDRESRHGIDKEAQEHWTNLVLADLNYLVLYQAN
jgi:hypothetical protein